jgi:serine/threonine-protein kinase
MDERRYAVLIASSHFPEEPRLENLRCPENDVDGLNEILASKDRGGFTEVTVFKNNRHHEILRKINLVLRNTQRDDLVLIYYSGHGKLDAAGRLHLTTADTELSALESTSIPVQRIRDFVDVSPTTKVVLLLDCCYSGAVEKAFLRGNVDEQLQHVSGGRGIYIMTASTAVQMAKEQETDRYGIFTKHIIGGIAGGGADRDGDGEVTVDELYTYVHDKVLEEGFQEPMKWAVNVRGDLILAKSGRMPREDRYRQIRQTLLELAGKEVLPDRILAKALDIAKQKPEELSGNSPQYDVLLDRLTQKRLNTAEFVDAWYAIEASSPPHIGLKPGMQIGHYEIENLMARGGMGVVWRGRDLARKEPVAIKAIANDLITNPSFRKRIQDEAHRHQKLVHPNIIPVTDVFESGGATCIVMKLINGPSLSGMLENQPNKRLDVDAAVPIIKDILNALDYAHRQGIVHRDVKPSNVLIDESNRAILIDFGIALAMGEDRLTRTGEIVGTTLYLSPEQINSPKTIDHRSDIYSVGCVFYEMLTGRPPFVGGRDGVEDSDFSIQQAHVNKLPSNPKTIVPSIPAKLDEVIMAALEKDPNQRISGCREFEKLLDDALRPAKRERGEVKTLVSDKRVRWAAIACLLLIPLAYHFWPGPAELPPEIEKPPAKPPPLQTKKHKLTVRATPLDSVIKILDSNFEYKPGVELERGPYDILVERDGYEPVRRSITLEKDLLVPIELARVIRKHKLTVRPAPPDSTVQITNIDQKYRPGIELEPGEYEIFVRRDGYEAKRQVVPIKDADVSVAVVLSELKLKVPSVVGLDQERAAEILRKANLSVGEVKAKTMADSKAGTVLEQQPQSGAEVPRETAVTIVVAKAPPLRNTFTNTIGIDFVRIPTGEFMMGTNDGDSDERPPHRVKIAKPFYLSKYEITQRQWEVVMGANPSFFKGDPDRPVESVSWDQVKEFIRKLNDKEGTRKYRLPTEAEWEYAARSGGKDEKWSGTSHESELQSFGWYTLNSDQRTQRVGGRKPNGLGLYDMSGNVWEWVEDCWHGTYQGAPPDGSAWLQGGGGDCGQRVMRGGSWDYRPVNLRSSDRGWVNADYRIYVLGFRLAQDVP